MPFKDPLAAGPNGVLIRNSVQSSNYLTGVSGWTINRDGSAEFSNVAIYGGQLKVSSPDGSYVWIHEVSSPAVGGSETAIQLQPPTEAGHTFTPAGVYTGWTGTQAFLAAISPSADGNGTAGLILLSDNGTNISGYQLVGLNNVLSGPIAYDDTQTYAAGTERFIGGTRAYLMRAPLQGRCTATLTLSTTNTAVPGCTVTVTTLNPNAYWEAEFSADAIIGTAGAIMVGTIQLNGVAVGGQAIHSGPAGARDSCTQTAIGTVPAAGTVLTFTMYGQLTGVSANNQYAANNSVLTVKIYE